MARHEQLWAPWRLTYVSGAANDPANRPAELLPGGDPRCFICRAAAGSADQQNLVVARSRMSIVVLNRFPYNNGHLLISPLGHEGRLDALSDSGLLDVQQLLAKYVNLMTKLMSAEGFNIGLNLGGVAGAGVPGHLHWHLVPRWSGDTNFMPTVAGAKVIPQSLEALWEMLCEEGSGQDSR